MITIPKSLKKEFNKGFDHYLKVMGRQVTVVLPPFIVNCPNCIWDSVRAKSTNVYDTQFIRPKNVFVGTSKQQKIYPQPFNVETAPAGIQYDPALDNPKILRTTVCPVCKGEGTLLCDRTICITGLVTWNPKEEFLDLSGGLDGQNICRIKTFRNNYALCRDAESFIVDGTECVLQTPPRVKGLGADHITEFYLIATAVDKSVSDKLDSDPRIIKDIKGSSSEQAPEISPDNPPTIPSEDGPW